MQKQSKKLSLRRETLRWLQAGDLSWARGRDEISIQSGETHCWCTDSCDTMRMTVGVVAMPGKLKV